MIELPVKHEEIKQWLPETYKVFIEELRNSKSRYHRKSEEDILWAVSWGPFIKKAKTDEERAENENNYKEVILRLPYEDRVANDLSKIRINVTMKAGNYIRVDRAFDTEIPKFIIDMTQEVLKITMLQEQKIINDPAVKESLKEFEYLLEELDNKTNEFLEMLGGSGSDLPKPKEHPLNMDDILDKINETGMGSLNAKELKFLEKMSR